MKPAELPFTMCATCARPINDGDVAVVLDLYEELIGSEGHGEPVNVMLSYTWCRACAPHFSKISEAVLAPARAVGAQDRASRGAH